jgi:transcription initiation factor TFIID TATA-box-binding protein
MSSEKSLQKNEKEEALLDPKEVPHQITNSVYLVDFGTKINSEAIIERFSNINYNPETFPGIIMEYNDSIKFLIFTSGKVMVVGAKNEKELKEAIEYLKKVFKKTKTEVKGEPKIEPKNVTTHLPDISKAIGTNFIELDKLVYYLDNVTYEPDIFPALFYKFYLKNGKIVSVTLFKNAKANLAGPRNEEEIQMAKEVFIKKLREVLKKMKEDFGE